MNRTVPTEAKSGDMYLQTSWTKLCPRGLYATPHNDVVNIFTCRSIAKKGATLFLIFCDISIPRQSNDPDKGDLKGLLYVNR